MARAASSAAAPSRSAMVTSAPSSASPRAQAKPMPLAPPVTSAVRPSSGRPADESGDGPVSGMPHSVAESLAALRRGPGMRPGGFGCRAGNAAARRANRADPDGSALLSRRRLSARSLDGGPGAGLLELGLGRLGGLLGGLLQDGIRCRVDEILGLLQAQTRDELANGLDDLDLLLAGSLENDVELVLLLHGLDRRGTECRPGGGNGDRSGGGDAEGLLELLHELGQFDESELLERVEQLVGGQFRHDGRPFRSGAPAGSRLWANVRVFGATEHPNIRPQ